MISVIAAGILAGFIAWGILAPLWREAGQTIDGPSAREAIRAQCTRCAQVLRDLELDFATGKVSSDDFQKTKLALEAELAALLEQADRTEKGQ